MKLPSTLAIALNLFVLTHADFHISRLSNTVISSGTSQTQWNSNVACPSNYYKCSCLTSGDRAADINGDFGSDFFQVKNGLCGLGWLNLYKQGDGHYDFYIAGGDGTKVGTCYWNSGNNKQCGIAGGSSIVVSDLNCYSYICGK